MPSSPKTSACLAQRGGSFIKLQDEEKHIDRCSIIEERGISFNNFKLFLGENEELLLSYQSPGFRECQGGALGSEDLGKSFSWNDN